MQLLGVDPSRPDAGRLKLAVELLEEGGVVALPTETVYGLAVDAFNPDALARLNRLKRKSEDSPILLLLSGVKQVEEVAAEVPPLFRELAALYWPGPLTDGWSLRARTRFVPRRGKSELRRAACWVTPRPGDGTESATESRPPVGAASRATARRIGRVGGKGETVR